MIASDATLGVPAPHPASLDTASLEREFPRSRDAVCLGVLLALALGIGIVWMPFSLYRLDNLTFYLPWYTELGRSLRSFDIPGWLPTTLSGAPMAGDPQSGWGYLPAMVIMTAFPSLAGYKLFLLFHILAAALTSYLYARNLGIGPIGALTTGLVFTLGNFLERTSCCTVHMQVAIWIPAVFLCIDLSQRAVTRTARIGWLLLAGLGASQIAAGWVGQGAYYGGLAVIGYMVYRCLISPRRPLRFRQRVVWLISSSVVMGVIAGSAALTAIVPRLDVVSRSTLSDLYDDGAGAREEIGWSISTLAERALGQPVREGRWYLGVVGLALAILAPLVVRRRRDVTFFALYTLIVLSLIVKGSPTIALFNLLPQFRSLHSHSPDRIYIVLFIGPALLAGFLVDALDRRRWRSLSPWGLMATVELPIVLIVAALILVQANERAWLPWYHIVLVIAVCIAVGVALVRVRPWSTTAAIVAVIAILLIDTPGHNAWGRITDRSSRSTASRVIDGYLEPNGAAQWLQQRRDEGEIFRYFGFDLAALTIPDRRQTYAVGHYRSGTSSILINNRGVQFGLDDIQGYNPVQVSRYVTYFRYLNGQSQSYHTSNVLENGIDSPLLDLLNVRYIVVPAQIPPGRPDLFHLAQIYPTVYLDGTNRILENPDLLPRTWIVHETVKTRTGQILPQFIDGSVDPSLTALIDGDAPTLSPIPAGATESVEITHRENDEIRLRVNAASRGMVILSEVWDPGWTATVDGEKARVYRADFLFRGVLVGPGEHEIVLRYPATDVKRTLAFYLIPLAAFALLGLVSARNRYMSGRRAPQDEERVTDPLVVAAPDADTDVWTDWPEPQRDPPES
jgi:hypothetical protein